MEEFFKNGFNWMVSQFGASMQSVTERLPWGILLLAGVAALFLLYAGYTVAHFVARGKYKKQLAEDIDAFDESKLSRKAIGPDVGSVGIIVIALLFLTGHAGFWAENGAAGFALCALLLVGAAAVFKLAHELCYHACRAAVRRAYWEISAEEEEDDEDDDDDEDDEDDEDGAAAPVTPQRPAAVYSPFSGGDDVYVPRPAAEPVKPVAPPVDADALRPGILEEIRKLKEEEEAPAAPMTEEEVLENLKEFDEEPYEDGEESLGAILAETLQDADYDYEDMDQNLAEEDAPEEEQPVSEVAEESQEPEQAAEAPAQETAETPVAPEPEEQEAEEEAAPPAEEPEVADTEAEVPAEAEIVQAEEAEELEQETETTAEPAPEEQEAPEEVEEAQKAEKAEEISEPAPEPVRTAKQLGDEEILREIERLKNSKPVPPEKAARRIAADAPEKETVSEPAPEKPARKKAPTSEELIDQARLARQTADNSEESMKTMQQIALLLQKEREKKKRKTPEEQRRMNEALADLLRAIGKKDE